MRRTLVTLFLVVLILGLSIGPTNAEQSNVVASAPFAAEDWDLPGGGHFFTQTGGGGGNGYSVTDEGGVRFWSEFKRLGGVQAVGYPVSQRFEWNGFICQAMQRAVFQWRPDTGSVAFVNVFDLMHEAGKDDWLTAVRQTPKPLGADFDAGLDWNGVVQKRLSLLDANPAIKAQYLAAVGDPIQMNGLPTSPITDMGNNYTLRCQRIVIQQWKQDVPWAKAGQVTVANGGSIAVEAGLIPGNAIQATLPATGSTAGSTAPAPSAAPAAPTNGVAGGVQVWVLGSERYERSRLSRPQPGNELITVWLAIENQNREPWTLNSLKFKLQDSNGVRRDYFVYNDREDDFDLVDLVYMGKIQGTLTFEVPKGDTGARLIFQPDYGWNGKELVLAIP